VQHCPQGHLLYLEIVAAEKAWIEVGEAQLDNTTQQQCSENNAAGLPVAKRCEYVM
jgi:hypothetical protein